MNTGGWIGGVAGVLALSLAACSDEPAAAAAVDGVGVTGTDGTGADVSGAADAPVGGDSVPTDAGEVVDAGPATDAARSADSAGADGGAAADAAPDPPPDAALVCPAWQPFDYKCEPGKPATCPGGVCTPLTKQCIGPKLDPHRWDDCGNGTCASCEGTKGCPADCGPVPVFSGSKAYAGKNTITVWVHGFSNQGADKLKDLTYGSVKGCGDVLKSMQGFGIARPCGDVPANDKNPEQFVSVEYYGTKPPAWMTAADIAQVDKFPFSGGPSGLQRYATIVAKFVKWRLAHAGASHVNLACHSMGCLIARHLIENDSEGLASGNHIVRWFTSTGVIHGAQLSRLFDNPAIQQGAKALGLELSDFILMNPDYVWDVTAAWDHKLFVANNPLFTGIRIHHVGAMDPKIKQALGVQLLDLNNPGDDPNDGIMYTHDQHFHGQAENVSPKAKSGDPVAPTATWVFADHMACPETAAAGLMATAALFHQRVVAVRLVESSLQQSSEGLLEPAPDDLALESEVRFDPYVQQAWQLDVKVHDDKVANRTAPLWQQKAGSTVPLQGVDVFRGPVLDGMTALRLDLKLIETDWYPHEGVKEVPFTQPAVIAEFHDFVKLVDGSVVQWKAKGWSGKLEVRVFDMP
ncbi:MAG: hypothetical protein EXR79_15515 [Myxococcales bacterium]|nr:hypothetical protein [Myxococcales bacterium]